MVDLTVEVTGFAELQQRLQKLEAGIPTAEILEDVGAVLLNRIRTRFLAQETPDGQAWTPSRASQRRASTGRGGGTLFDTGNLFRSIQLFRDNSEQLRIGIDVEYAVYQQGPMAPVERTFLGFSDDDVSLVADIAQARIVELLI